MLGGASYPGDADRRRGGQVDSPLDDRWEADDLPPIPHLAAFRRMASDPHLFDDFEEDTWVAFSGDTIIAAGPSLEEVIREAAARGEDDPLIVPLMPDPFLGD